MAKLICSVEKYGENGIQNVQKHHDRESVQDMVVHPDRTGLNYAVVPLPGPTLESCIVARVARRDSRVHVLRKDAVVLCEVTVSVSDEYVECLSEKDSQRFFETTSAFLTGRYGESNCMYAFVHMDEEAPHLHFGFVPMTKEGRLSAKRMLGDEELAGMELDLSAYLLECGFDISQARERKPIPVEAASAPDVAIDLAVREAREEVKRLSRENQRLQLENILLQRQLNNLLGMIDNEPQLEALLLQEIEKQTVQKREWLKQCNPERKY